MFARSRFGLVAGILLAAGTGSAPIAARPAHPARTYTVVIDSMKFGAVPAGLRVGDAIRWVNRDIFRHSATAGDRSFDLDLTAGKSGSTTLRRPGTISVSCKFHPGMKTRLVVSR